MRRGWFGILPIAFALSSACADVSDDVENEEKTVQSMTTTTETMRRS